MAFLGIHHMRFAVADPVNFANFLVKQFGFKSYAQRQGTAAVPAAVVLRHQSAMFIINQRLESPSLAECNNNDGKIPFLAGNIVYPVDTCCDICFECHDIDEIVKRADALKKGSCVARDEIRTKDGKLSFAIIQSPIGNLQHTLIDSTDYHGKFLPDFQLDEAFSSFSDDFIFCIDHIALNVPKGYIDKAISWYNFVYGFERLLINQHDTPDEGFLIRTDAKGMRLKAIHGMKLCATNCAGNNTSENLIVPAKLVFGESHSDDGKRDQIKLFLDEHGGMGVQHVGLGTRNIINAVRHFKELGTTFMVPPPEYFADDTKLREIAGLALPVDEIKDTGVMVESSAGGTYDKNETEISIPAESEAWYIMQVFTKNIFKERTFFMELIQRHRTDGGFGAGNIRALWKSVQAHIAKTEAVQA